MSALNEDATRSSVVLQCDARAPRRVRRVVHDMCARAAVPARAVDTAMFVAGELVSTSARHAQGSLVVEMSVDDDTLTVRVHYSAPGPVPQVNVKPTVGAMRGWDVVRRLSNGFGYASAGDRHEVWARLSASGRPPGTGRRAAATA
jgi:hypothetical protein